MGLTGLDSMLLAYHGFMQGIASYKIAPTKNSGVG